MKPLITSRPLSDFTSSRQKSLCKCTRRCSNVLLIIQDELVYQICEKGAVEFVNEILKVTGRVDDPTRLLKNEWSSIEIQQLKDYINSVGGKVPKGAYTKLGKLIGKDRIQIRDKVRVLRARGDLPLAPRE